MNKLHEQTSILCVLGAMLVAPSQVNAATFELIETKKFSQWEGNLYINARSHREFCAAETTNADGTVFRVNQYKDNQESFLEIFNPKWSWRKGGIRFAISFDQKYSADFKGKSWGDSYTHDFHDEEKRSAVLGLASIHKRATVHNSNGTPVGVFSLSGAKEALQLFRKCIGES